jgi:hypothetical protein
MQQPNQRRSSCMTLVSLTPRCSCDYLAIEVPYIPITFLNPPQVHLMVNMLTTVIRHGCMQPHCNCCVSGAPRRQRQKHPNSIAFQSSSCTTCLRLVPVLEAERSALLVILELVLARGGCQRGCCGFEGNASGRAGQVLAGSGSGGGGAQDGGYGGGRWRWRWRRTCSSRRVVAGLSNDIRMHSEPCLWLEYFGAAL